MEQMNADLLVEIPGHAPCAVRRKELVMLLDQKGWREIAAGVWTAPIGHEPDTAFLHLSRSLRPRRIGAVDDGEAEAKRELAKFRRRCDLGENVWAIG
jgi:hypothetical protein